MSSVHIFAAKPQPMTRYFDENFPPRGRWFKTSPRKRYTCHFCRSVREARNLTIQVYYDTTRIRCAGGCK
jgi:hypothetical protein